MTRVTALDHVAFHTRDLATATRFYVDQWGLTLVEGNDEVSYLAAGNGNHHDLILQKGDQNRFDYVAFAVRNINDMDELAGRVRQTGSEIVRERGCDDVPGESANMLLRDPDDIIVKLVVPKSPGANAIYSPNTIMDRPGPLAIGHVVLRSTKQTEQEKFYANLGLYVSDRTSVGMSFLRCNEDHHSLALSHSASAGLHHVAWDIATIENVERVRERMEGSGHKVLWGIGRHGPGNNVFSYYKDPMGNFIEMYAEMEKVPLSDQIPIEKTWGPEHGGDISGQAGPVPAIFKV